MICATRGRTGRRRNTCNKHGASIGVNYGGTPHSKFEVAVGKYRMQTVHHMHLVIHVYCLIYSLRN